MDFDYTASEQSFREEVRSFISDNLPPKKERDKNFLANWLEKVRAKGWVGFAWPKEFGGSEGGREAGVGGGDDASDRRVVHGAVVLVRVCCECLRRFLRLRRLRVADHVRGPRWDRCYHRSRNAEGPERIRRRDAWAACPAHLPRRDVGTEQHTQQHYGGRIRIRIRRLPPLRGP